MLGDCVIMATKFSHADIIYMELEDQHRFNLIRSSGLPIPNPVSKRELEVLAVEARALLTLRTENRQAYQREIAVSIIVFLSFVTNNTFLRSLSLATCPMDSTFRRT